MVSTACITNTTGSKKADIVATIQLDDALRQSFKDIVMEVSGKDKVELIEKIDPKLIGGFNPEDRGIGNWMKPSKASCKQLRLGFTQNLYEKKY